MTVLAQGQFARQLLIDVERDLAGGRLIGIISIAFPGQAMFSLPGQLPEQIVAFAENGEDRRRAATGAVERKRRGKRRRARAATR
jgi:hypothetical protein